MFRDKPRGTALALDEAGSVHLPMFTAPFTVGPQKFRAAPALATSNSPPLSLPGGFFIAAMACLILGSFGLAWIAPYLAAGAFYVPAVIVVTHLFTLGFITLSVCGALCQFLPVAVGRALRWPTLARVSLFLLVTGLALFEHGLLVHVAFTLRIGASLLAVGLAAFAIDILATVANVRDHNTTWWSLTGAATCLLITLGWGFSVALNQHSAFIRDRFSAVFIHAHVALFGWVGLVMIAVAGHLQTMFLVVHGVSQRAAAIAVGLILTGVGLAALPLGSFADGAGLVAMWLGLSAFLLQSALNYRARLKRHLGPGLELAAAGLCVLLLALMLAPFAAWLGLGAPRLLTAYVLLVIGAISLFIAGHYYKIVPFLIWFHRYSEFVGQKPVPNVADLFSERLARLSVVTLPAGLLGIALSVIAGSEIGIRGSALVFAAGAVVESVQLAAVARRGVT